jgi:O-Antigen ligase
VPENLKAFVIVLSFGGLFFLVMKSLALEHGMLVKTYQRRVIAWVIITALAFLAHNFWVFIGGAFCVLLWLGANERLVVGNYFFLLFCAPEVAQEIPGFGLVNMLFVVDNYRILCLGLLVPALWRRSKTGDLLKFGALRTDWYISAYVAVYFFLGLQSGTFTDNIRTGLLYGWLDIFLPYYVASRFIRNQEDLKDALLCLLYGLGPMALVGVFEFFSGWLVYEAAKPELGTIATISSYIGRGDFIRAVSSTGKNGPIPLGYAMMIGLCLYWSVVRRNGRFTAKSALLGIVLVGGSIASISKGPWLGLSVGLLVFVALLQRNKLSPLIGSVCIGVFTTFLAFSAVGNEVLVQIGILDSDIDFNVTYRQNLINMTLQVLADQPFFGASDFLLRPEVQAMRQGQGIIDIVNTYAGIGLTSGLLGLSAFVGFFFSVLMSTYRSLASNRKADLILVQLVTSIFAAIVAALFTIFTVSSVSIIPLLYWSLAGAMMGAVTQIEQRYKANQKPKESFAAGRPQ